MKKRVKKKLTKNGAIIKIEYTHCQECGKILHAGNQYHRLWGTCNVTCHSILVDMYE